MTVNDRPRGFLRPLDESALDAAAIHNIATRGVLRTIRFAARHSAFYRRHFARIGLSPRDIRTLNDLARMPPTEKSDVAQAGRSLWACDPSLIRDIVTSSGTTGEPLLYPLTARDLRRLAYNEYLSLGCAGITPGQVVGLGVTLDKCFMAGLAYYEGLRMIGATSVRIGAGAPAMVLAMIERTGLSSIISVPSYLDVIARFAQQRGIDLRKKTVRRLVCIGEPIRDKNMQPTPLAARIAEQWGATLHSSYGITELAMSMCECPAGCGVHLHPELVHAEIMDEQLRPVPDGEIGELVATTIGVQGMPLIRFRTGDITFMRTDRCACGRRTPRLGTIVSRRNQMLKIKGATVYPSMVIRTLAAFPQVIDFVMIARSSNALSDELVVMIAMDQPGDALAAEITEALRGQLRVRIDVLPAGLEQIRRLKNPGDLRKDRVFIDERPSNL